MSIAISNTELIKSHIKAIQDFPIEGILFRDILPIFQDHLATEALLYELTKRCKQLSPDYVFALDSRGFLFAPAVSSRLGIPFVPIRKRGKLPGELVTANYTKEYGTDSFETYKMKLNGKRVVILDDLLATGGSVLCAKKLVEQNEGEVVGYVFAIELTELNASQKLGGPTLSVIQY
eukprot:NODE_199_length_15263_cov_0.256331.p7 type:complete len:177 gc:universal NODE_199_length_15263_cov_0.256331:12397-12927(+)